MNKGRPTVINKSSVQKLVDGFRCGLNVEEACSYAEISTSTFYNHLRFNQDFLDKITVARNYMRLKAQSIVMNALENNDLKTAKWYLEKYDNKEPEKIEIPKMIEGVQSQEEIIERAEQALMAIKGEGIYARHPQPSE